MDQGPNTAVRQFVFDPIKHIYMLDGQVLPSTTQIINWMNRYAGVPEAVLEEARQIGDAVHLATALFDHNDLDEESVDPVVEPYLEAWKAFKADTGFMVSFVERPIYSETYRYATTPDRGGRFSRDSEDGVLEIKTTATILPSCGPQTAAQKQAMVEWGFLKPTAPRYTVQLCPEKKPAYRVVKHSDPNDMAVFLSSLNVHNWKIRNGYKG